MDVSAWAIPSLLGDVVESWQPPGRLPRAFVIHVQDLHAHPEAQQRISDLIGHLHQQMGLDFVAVEGTEGWCDTSLYADLPDPPSTERMARLFMQEGLFSGAEYRAITHPDDVVVWGVEDEAVYREHLAVYQRNEQANVAATEVVDRLAKALQARANSLYPSDIRRLATLHAVYDQRDDEGSFTDYLHALTTLARAGRMKLDAYPRVRDLLAARQLHGRIDLRQVETERLRLTKALAPQLTPAEHEALAAANTARAQQRLSERAYYDLLQRLARQHDVLIQPSSPIDWLRAAASGSWYQALPRYLEYLALADRLRSRALRAELSALERAAIAVRLTTEPQRALARLQEQAALLSGLLRIQLTPDEYAAYRRLRSQLAAGAVWQEIQQAGAGNAITRQELEDVLSHLEAHERFYELALRRDQALVANTLRQLASRQRPLALLVAGGFHTPGITAQLQSQDIAYVVVAPRVTAPADEATYKARLDDVMPTVPDLLQKLESQALVQGSGFGMHGEAPTRLQIPAPLSRDGQPADVELRKRDGLFLSFMPGKVKLLKERVGDWIGSLRAWIQSHPREAALYGLALAVVGGRAILSAMGVDLTFEEGTGVLIAMAVLPPGDRGAAVSAEAIAAEEWFVRAHPTTGYHTLRHSVTAAERARALALAKGLTPQEADFIYTVILLHDFDPNRPPGTPPRVPTTVELLADDFNAVRSLDGRAGASFLKETLGWRLREYLMARAIIQRTEFPFAIPHVNPWYQAHPTSRGLLPLDHYRETLFEMRRLAEERERLPVDDPQRDALPSREDIRFVLQEAPFISENSDKMIGAATMDFPELVADSERLVEELNAAAGTSAMSLSRLNSASFLAQLVTPAAFEADRALAGELGYGDINFTERAQALDLLPGDRRRVEANTTGFQVLQKILSGHPDDPATLADAKAAGTAVAGAFVAGQEASTVRVGSRDLTWQDVADKTLSGELGFRDGQWFFHLAGGSGPAHPTAAQMEGFLAQFREVAGDETRLGEPIYAALRAAIERAFAAAPDEPTAIRRVEEMLDEAADQTPRALPGFLEQQFAGHPPAAPAPERFGTRMRAAREARGLSRRELGRLAGVADSTVRRVEEGEIVPEADTKIRLANGLGMAVQALDPESAPPMVEFSALATYGERLRALREFMGMTQDQLAERADVALRTIRRIERGEAPEAATRLRLAAALGVSPADLEPGGYQMLEATRALPTQEERLQALMRNLAIDGRTLSEISGVPRSTISRALRGEHKLTEANRGKLERALAVRAGMLDAPTAAQLEAAARRVEAAGTRTPEVTETVAAPDEGTPVPAALSADELRQMVQELPERTPIGVRGFGTVNRQLLGRMINDEQVTYDRGVWTIRLPRPGAPPLPQPLMMGDVLRMLRDDRPVVVEGLGEVSKAQLAELIRDMKVLLVEARWIYVGGKLRRDQPPAVKAAPAALGLLARSAAALVGLPAWVGAAFVLVGAALMTWWWLPHAWRARAIARLRALLRGRQEAQAPPQPRAANAPDPDTVRKSPIAFEYRDDTQGFAGVDLEHFVHAQTRLAERNLSLDALEQLLRLLELSPGLTTEAAYQAIYRQLAQRGYTTAVVDLINGRSYNTVDPPRLDVEIVGQNRNPRAQAVYEAVANSLDALGFHIGQFGKGVKQILDWLELTGLDRVDVWTANGRGAYRLTILKDRQGQSYIQVAPISLQAFQQAAGRPFARGTVVKVTVQTAIPRTDADRDAQRRNSQQAIAEGIHRRFPYVTAVRMTTQTAQDAAPQEVNGFQTKHVIVPTDGAPLRSAEAGGPEIHVAMDDHTVTIADNGSGMDAEAITRMFVPKRTIKRPALQEVTVVHDPTLPRRVSFSRSGEVVVAVDVPEEVQREATVSGGLMVEFGGLLDVSEEREQVIIPLDLKPGERSNFERAVEQAIGQLISHPRLTAMEKVRYVNTIVVGLEGLIQGNENYAHVIKKIRGQVKQELAGLIGQLRQEGFVVLPHDRPFEQLALPEGKPAVFVDEHLFDWQGAVSLRALGAEIVPGLTMGGEKRLPLVVARFKPERVTTVSAFHRLWHRWTHDERLPFIRTDRFIAIPVELGGRLSALARKRVQGLTPKEEREFVSLVQRLNILTAAEVVTSYEVAKPKENIAIAPQAELAKSAGEIDSEAINAFLTKPPVVAGAARGRVPADANQRYVLKNEGDIRVLVEVGTGRVVLRNVAAVEALGRGYYRLERYVATEWGFKVSEEISRAREDGSLDAVFQMDGSDGELLVSPDKRFAVAQTRDGVIKGFFDLSRSELHHPPAKTGTSHHAQCSRDGTYLTYLNVSSDGKLHLSIDNLRTGVTKRHRIGDASNLPQVSYAVNPFADVAVLQKSVLGNEVNPFTLYDLASGELVRSGAHMRTDSTGTYTAVADDKGAMTIYLHEAQRTLDKHAFGGEPVVAVSTFWRDGQTLFEAMTQGEAEGHTWLFDKTGDVRRSVDPNWFRTKPYYYEMFDHQGSVVVRSKERGDRVTPFVSSSPLQSLTSRGVYKHPKFDLFIDNNNPEYPVAVDPTTGSRFPVRGEEIVRYEVKPSGRRYLFYRRQHHIGYGATVQSFESFPAEETRASGTPYYAVMDRTFPRFQVSQGDAGHYILMDFALSTILIVAGINSKANSEVSFDGTYFLFVNPKTGDVVYLDPEKPDQPIVVPISGEEEPEPVPQEIPADANQRHVLLANGDVVDLRTGNIVDRKVQQLQAVGHGYYYVRTGLEELFGHSEQMQMLVPDTSATPPVLTILSSAGSIRVSPNGQFAYAERTDGSLESPKLIELGTGRAFYLDNDFAEEPRPSGRTSTERLRSLQFSQDGNYLIYLVDSPERGETRPVIVDLQQKQMSWRFGQDSDDEMRYAIHPLANVLYAQSKVAKATMLIDLTNGAAQFGSKLRTDSTGAYTAILNEGKFEVYLHETGLTLTAKDFNAQRIDRVVTGWRSGLPQFEVVVDGGFIWRFSSDGVIGRMSPERTLAQQFDYYESFSAQGTLSILYDRETRVLDEPSYVDPLQRVDGEGVSYHPELVLFIIKDSDGLTAIDPITNRRFRYRGELAGYDKENGLLFFVDSGKLSSTTDRQSVGDTIFYGDIVASSAQRVPGVPKSFIVRDPELPEIFALFNFETNRKSAVHLNPQQYDRVSFDGKYFVFTSSATGQAAYLDPDAAGHTRWSSQPIVVSQRRPAARGEQPAEASPEALKAQQEALTRWNKEVLSRRDGWIAQARAAYRPFLKRIPEEHRRLVEPDAKKTLERLYRLQDDAVRQQFQAAPSGEPLNISEMLPFDTFTQRLQVMLPLLGAYLEANADRLSQEPYEAQESMYRALFAVPLTLAAHSLLATDVSQLDQRQLEVMGLGWVIQAAEQYDALPVLADLVTGLRDASQGQIALGEAGSIVKFLWATTVEDPAQRTPVLTGQLKKILSAKLPVRQVFLSRMRRAFAHADPEALARYLKDPSAIHELGEARAFVAFFTSEVEQVRENGAGLPAGEDVALPAEGVEISQIAKLELERPKADTDGVVMSVDYLIEHLSKLPGRSEEIESEVRQNATVQAESGAYAREIPQNSLDATEGRQGELVVDFFLQRDEGGREVYVEEARDNGTGALQEVALLIPNKSPKAAGRQLEQAGFFGTGKYTIFEGVDRVELITKNEQRAFLFVFTVTRDDSGKPITVRLTRIRRLTDPRIAHGVAVRRVKFVDHTIPELDQMLALRAWKTFAGLAQHERFTIFIVDHEGQRHPLTVQSELLSQAEFRAVKPGTGQAASFGTMRLRSTKDLPLQVVEKRGLRVRELKEEYLALIPAALRHHIKELGLVIQIPLPLIRSRTAFEHEQDYLPTIQKYVAIEFYKAIAYKTLTQTAPQFVFEGFPLDWETNNDYWNSIDLRDRALVELAERINKGEYEAIAEQELQELLTKPGELDKQKRFVRLLVLLQVPIDSKKPQERTSLLLRRLAIQEQINKARAEAQRRRFEDAGLTVGRAPDVRDVPYFEAKVGQALRIETAHEQMRHPERYLVDPADYSEAERELVELALSAAKHAGLEQVLLLRPEVRFAGAFRQYRGKHTMFLNRAIAGRMGRPDLGRGFIDAGTDTIVHELAHFLEELMRSDDAKADGALWREGFVAHTSDFSHDAIGTFAEAMKYMAAVWLTNHAAPVPAAEEPAHFQAERRRDQPPAVKAAPAALGLLARSAAALLGLPAWVGAAFVLAGAALMTWWWLPHAWRARAIARLRALLRGRQDAQAPPEGSVRPVIRPAASYLNGETLLAEPYRALDAAARSVVNPFDAPLTSVYGGAGADLTNFLLSTGSTTAFFVAEYSLTTTKLRKLLQRGTAAGNALAEYISNKHAYGYGFYSTMEVKPEFLGALAAELIALGVRFEDVVVDEDEGHPRLRFAWAAPGGVVRERSITFINADITKPLQYPPRLVRALREGIGLYYQRAGYQIPLAYQDATDNFIRALADAMPGGGFFVTDDHRGDTLAIREVAAAAFPLDLPTIPLPDDERLRESVFEFRRLNAPEMHQSRYGWDLAIRRVPAAPPNEGEKRPVLQSVEEIVDWLSGRGPDSGSADAPQQPSSSEAEQARGLLRAIEPAGVSPEAVTELVYPAAGWDSRLLRVLVGAFPQLRTIHLIDTAYRSVPPDGSDAVASERWVAQVKGRIEQEHPGRPIDIQLHGEDYLTYRVSRKTPGRRVFVDKYPDLHGWLRKDPRYYRGFMEDAREGDVILTLHAEDAAEAFRWPGQVADGLTLPLDHDRDSTRWSVSLRRAEDEQTLAVWLVQNDSSIAVTGIAGTITKAELEQYIAARMVAFVNGQWKYLSSGGERGAVTLERPAGGEGSTAQQEQSEPSPVSPGDDSNIPSEGGAAGNIRKKGSQGELVDLEPFLQKLHDETPKTAAYLKSLGRILEVRRENLEAAVYAVKLDTTQGERWLTLKYRATWREVKDAPEVQHAMHVLTPDVVPDVYFTEMFTKPDEWQSLLELVVYDYAPGRRLLEYLSSLHGGRGFTAERMAWLDQLFQSIGASMAVWHNHGYHKRDSNFANILVDPDGLPQPALIDFGFSEYDPSDSGVMDIQQVWPYMDDVPSYETVPDSIKRRWREAFVAGYRSKRTHPEIEKLFMELLGNTPDISGSSQKGNSGKIGDGSDIPSEGGAAVQESVPAQSRQVASPDEQREVLDFIRSLGFDVRPSHDDWNPRERATIHYFGGMYIVYADTEPLTMLEKTLEHGLNLEGRRRVTAEIVRRYPDWQQRERHVVVGPPAGDPAVHKQAQAQRYQLLREVFLEQMADGTLNTRVGKDGLRRSEVYDFLQASGATFDQLRQLVGEPLRSFSELSRGDLVLVHHGSSVIPSVTPAIVLKVLKNRMVEVLETGESFSGSSRGTELVYRPDDVMLLATTEDIHEFLRTGIVPVPALPTEKLRRARFQAPLWWKRLIGKDPASSPAQGESAGGTARGMPAGKQYQIPISGAVSDTAGERGAAITVYGGRLAAPARGDDLKRADVIVRHGLERYPVLVSLLTKPIVQILEDDSTVRPVFLLLLPDEAMGPLEVVDRTAVDAQGGETLLQDYSAFLIGSPAVANRLAAEGQRVVAAVVDRGVGTPASVMHGRTCYVPLADETWLALKGSGQFRDPDQPPHYPGMDRAWGLVSEDELRLTLASAPLLQARGAWIAQPLGFRRLLKLPDGQGHLSSTDALLNPDDRRRPLNPVLIFNRFRELHRFSELPYLWKADPGLAGLRSRLSHTLVRLGELPDGHVLSVEELIMRAMAQLGRTEAIKQQAGLTKITIHSQDFTLAGEESDNEELITSTKQARRMAQVGTGAYLEDSGTPPDQPLDLSGLMAKVQALAEVLWVISDDRERTAYLPDRLALLRSLFTAYFAALDDQRLQVWATPGADGLSGPLGILSAQDRLGVFHPKNTTLHATWPWTQDVAAQMLRWAQDESARRGTRNVGGSVAERGAAAPRSAGGTRGSGESEGGLSAVPPARAEHSEADGGMAGAGMAWRSETDRRSKPQLAEEGAVAHLRSLARESRQSAATKKSFEQFIHSYIDTGFKEPAVIVEWETDSRRTHDMPTLEYLLADQGRMRRFLEVLGALRLAYPYEISTHSPLTPLEGAQQHNAIFQLGELKIVPITESFRRHIVYVQRDGVVINALELKIPGQRQTDNEQWTVDRRHIDIARRLWKAYPQDPGVVRPVFYARLAGPASLYSDRSIATPTMGHPIEMVAFEYEDGKRFSNVLHAPEVMSNMAKNLGMQTGDLYQRIFIEGLVRLIQVHQIGYRGGSTVLQGGSDLHWGNFRLLTNGHLVSVGDYESYQPLPTQGAMQARQEDILWLSQLFQPLQYLRVREILDEVIEQFAHHVPLGQRTGVLSEILESFDQPQSVVGPILERWQQRGWHTESEIRSGAGADEGEAGMVRQAPSSGSLTTGQGPPEGAGERGAARQGPLDSTMTPEPPVGPPVLVRTGRGLQPLAYEEFLRLRARGQVAYDVVRSEWVFLPTGVSGEPPREPLGAQDLKLGNESERGAVRDQLQAAGRKLQTADVRPGADSVEHAAGSPEYGPGDGAGGFTGGRQGPPTALPRMVTATMVTAAAISLLPAVLTGNPLAALSAVITAPLVAFPVSHLLSTLWLIRPATMRVLTGQERMRSPTFTNTPRPITDPARDLGLAVTVHVPVYTEPFPVIRETLDHARMAVDAYNQASPAGANLIVSDDALMLWAGNDLERFLRQAEDLPEGWRSAEQREALERVAYYRRHGIAFVARPALMAHRPETLRAGLFKKASNLNHALRLADAAAAHGSGGSRLAAALREPAFHLTHAEGDVAFGDVLLLLDKDSLAARDVLVRTVPEFVHDPALAYTQHRTYPSNADESYFTRIMGVFTRLLYDLIIPGKVSQGAHVPFMGHNGLVRTAVLRDLDYWHEGRVSEDLDFSMRAHAAGFHGKYVAFDGLDFTEQVSRVFSEEVGKFMRYAYGIGETLLQPVKRWRHEGVITAEFKAYWKSPHTRWYHAVDLWIYQLSFVNLALILPGAVMAAVEPPSIQVVRTLATLLFFTVTPLSTIMWLRWQSARAGRSRWLAGGASDFARLGVLGFLFMGYSIGIIRGFVGFLGGWRPYFPASSVEEMRETRPLALARQAGLTRYEAGVLGPILSGLLLIFSMSDVWLWQLLPPLVPLAMPLLLPFLMHPPLIQSLGAAVAGRRRADAGRPDGPESGASRRTIGAALLVAALLGGGPGPASAESLILPTSQDYLSRAWESYSQSDYHQTVLWLEAMRRIHPDWLEAALDQQRRLAAGEIDGGSLPGTWALRDIAAADWLLAQAYVAQGQPDRARLFIEDLKRFPGAQIPDPGGWQWNPLQKAREVFPEWVPQEEEPHKSNERQTDTELQHAVDQETAITEWEDQLRQWLADLQQRYPKAAREFALLESDALDRIITAARQLWLEGTGTTEDLQAALAAVEASLEAAHEAMATRPAAGQPPAGRFAEAVREIWPLVAFKLQVDHGEIDMTSVMDEGLRRTIHERLQFAASTPQERALRELLQTWVDYKFYQAYRENGRQRITAPLHPTTQALVEDFIGLSRKGLDVVTYVGERMKWVYIEQDSAVAILADVWTALSRSAAARKSAIEGDMVRQAPPEGAGERGAAAPRSAGGTRGPGEESGSD